MIQAAISLGSERYLGEIALGTVFSREHLKLVKRHPAFNDDYDIPWAFLSFLSWRQENGIPNNPDPEAWAEALRPCPPSPELAISWVTCSWGHRVPRDDVRIVCDRLYFGEAYARIRPETTLSGLGQGFFREEQPMIHCSWRDLPLPCAIYTGRSRGELGLVLERLEWGDFPTERIVTMDDGIVKPSSQGLAVLSRRLGAAHPLYFGDAESDLAAYRAFGRGGFVAVGDVLTGWRPRYRYTEDALQDVFSPPFRKGIALPCQ